MKVPRNGVARDIRHFSGSVFVFVLIVTILFYLTKYTIPNENAQIVNTLIGMIAASVAMVISSITGQKPDELNNLKSQLEKKEHTIEFLVKEKDRLEGMIIDLQKQILENYDNTLDRIILGETLRHDLKNNPPKKL
mgnify:CR=1 FL=1|tara:strand:- start:7510 stop:7917 length:408 start_codon:yes stop_codon:yes gene_type:complete